MKKEFSGSWIAMLDQVLEYVNLYNDTSARVIGNSATRTEVQSYPDPSLREIVVNALHILMRASLPTSRSSSIPTAWRSLLPAHSTARR